MEAQLRTALKKEETKYARQQKVLDETGKMILFYKEQIKALNNELPLEYKK